MAKLQQFINVDTITCVELFGEEIENNFKWLEKTPFTLNIFKHRCKKSGFYFMDEIFHDHGFIASNADEFLKSNVFNDNPKYISTPRSEIYHIGEDGKTVYINSRVVIHTADGQGKTKYFKTMEEAKSFVDDLLNEIPHTIKVTLTQEKC